MQNYYTAEEMAQLVHTTAKELTIHFPNVAVAKLKKGLLLEREKKNNIWYFDVHNVEPREASKDEFQIMHYNRGKKDSTSLPNEIWIDTYVSPNYEVSNLGRVRNKKTFQIHNGTKTHSGYQTISIQNKDYFLHRLVLISFSPIPDYEHFQVDHINGKRNDNRLENLRWATDQDNTAFIYMNRKEITKEVTRLIIKYGYDNTLNILQNIT